MMGKHFMSIQVFKPLSFAKSPANLKHHYKNSHTNINRPDKIEELIGMKVTRHFLLSVRRGNLA